MLKKLLLTATVGSMIFLALFLGCLLGIYKERQRRFNSERIIIENIFKKDGFESINLQMYTGDGSAFLVGQVSSQQEFDRLRKILDVTFGRSTEVDRMCGISIASVK